MLDLAAGSGRHTRLLLDMGLWVTAVDRDIAALKELAGARCTVREIDLENGEAEPHAIYGEASAEESRALADEGIEFGRIPWIQTDA